jgi:hypothetical protein
LIKKIKYFLNVYQQFGLFSPEKYMWLLGKHPFVVCASSLKQQSAGRHVAPLGHIILISNQSLLFLLNAACLAEKQQIPILYSLV